MRSGATFWSSRGSTRSRGAKLAVSQVSKSRPGAPRLLRRVQIRGTRRSESQSAGRVDVCSRISLSLVDLSPLNPPPEDHLLVVLKSYFDGSNKADSSEYDRISIATVCGTGKEWKRFDTEWRKVLYRHCADYLHTTDAVSLRNSQVLKVL